MAQATILIVEDNALTRKALRASLESAQYIVQEASDGRTAIEMVRSRPPDLIVQDLLLPDVDGIKLLARIRQLPHAASIPVIACSGMMSKIEEARTLQASFTDYLFKPFELAQLRNMVARYLPTTPSGGVKPGKQRRILLVDDDAVQLRLTARQLTALEFAVTTAQSGAQALELATKVRPDAFVVDLLMPGMTGFDLCLTIRRRPGLSEIPLIVLATTFAVIEQEDRNLARNMGVNALVVRTPSLDEVVEALLTALKERRAPAVADDAQTLNAAFTERLVRQLKHQSVTNQTFARRVAMDAALLSVTSGAAALVTERRDIPQLLNEVLTRTLDAGGVSMGAVYVNEPGESQRLRPLAHLGFSEERVEGLADFFGEMELLKRITDQGLPVSLPSSYFEWELESALLERIGVDALLIVPLVARGASEGSLIISPSKYEQKDEWIASVRAVGTQLAQAIALARVVDQLTASEVMYRSLFEGLPTGIYRTLPNGRIIDVNPALLQLLGYEDRKPLLAMTVSALYVDPADGKRWRDLMDADGMVTNFEAQMRRRDGTPIWVSTTAQLARGGVGGTLHCEGAAVDITKRKIAEGALASSEAYYRLLFEASPLPMWVTDAETHAFLAVNESAVSLYGYTRAEFLPMTVEALTAPTTAAPARAGKTPNVPDTGTQFVRVQHKKKNGTIIDVEITSARFTFEGRSARLAVAHDVSDRKQLERQLLQAQKMEAIGQLAGGIAHDFNNLLTVMKGCGGLLLEQMGETDPHRDNVSEIVNAADRAAVLTRQLLAFSRRQVLDPQPLDLNIVVTDMEKMLRRLVTESIEFRMALDPDLGVVKADPGQIEQVIANLAVNARDAMPNGGHLTIATGNASLLGGDPEDQLGAPPGSYVMLSISDTGMGMDEATRARIFEPFFSTKTRAQGTGLGLSTVYGIVKQSGGYIRLQSDPGQGTTFEIYLPRVDAKAGRRSGEQAPVKQLHGTERILIVEDDEAVRQIVSMVLKSLGYSVIVARDGQEALSMASALREEPALVITDIVMPRMNGHQLVVELRHRWPSLRVLFMSGYSEEVAADQNVMPTGSVFVQKPFLPAQLAQKVREALDWKS
jgi:two-component system, cell cycle sensor histidine kinase and response regulator CckA